AVLDFVAALAVDEVGGPHAREAGRRLDPHVAQALDQFMAEQHVAGPNLLVAAPEQPCIVEAIRLESGAALTHAPSRHPTISNAAPIIRGNLPLWSLQPSTAVSDQRRRRSSRNAKTSGSQVDRPE